MKRKPISKKLRFAVFERDNFTCQYCGRRPDEDNIVLHADHTVSVKDKGTNDIENLITSCSDCNFGKGAKSILKKTKTVDDLQAELNLAEERLAQVRQMNKKRDAILKITKKINKQKTLWITDIFDISDEKLTIKIQTLYEKKEYSKEIMTEALQILAGKDFSDETTTNSVYAYFLGICRNLILSDEDREILKLYNTEIFKNERMYPAVRKIILDYTPYGIDFHQKVITNILNFFTEKHGESYKTRDLVLEYINRKNFTVYKSGINLQVLVCDTIVFTTEDLIDN